MSKNIILFILISIFMYGCFPKPTDYNGKYPPRVAAEKNLDLAQRAIDEDYYEEAYQILDFVKNHYPYELDAQEHLRVLYGDILFKQDKYIDAISIYQTFIKIHPNSKYVPYAQFKIARSYYEDMPTDFILFPPPYERDRNSIVYAQKALIFYIGNYPKGKNIKEAKKMLQKTLDYLANYQFYVGNFYYKREKYKGAVRRFKNVIFEHPRSSYVKESIYKSALSYIRLKDGVNAKKYMQLFAKKYPKSSELAKIKEEFKDTKFPKVKSSEKTSQK